MKNNVKKITALVLALTIMILSSACGKKTISNDVKSTNDATGISSYINSLVSSAEISSASEEDNSSNDTDSQSATENGDSTNNTTAVNNTETNGNKTPSSNKGNGGQSTKPNQKLSTKPNKKPSVTSTPQPKPTPTPQPKPESQPTKLYLPTADQLVFMENEMARLVNEYRVQKGLPTYRTPDFMYKAAKQRATESAPLGKAHHRPDGRNWSTIFDQFYSPAPEFEGMYDDENDCWIKWNVDNEEKIGPSAENQGWQTACGRDSGIEDVPVKINASKPWTTEELKAVVMSDFLGYKKSPKHNAAMLSTHYPRMGIGYGAAYFTTNQGTKEVSICSIQLFA